MDIDTIMGTSQRVTPAQTKAAFAATIAVTEAIRELGEIPSGHMYARLCDKMSLECWERMEKIIVGTGLVEKRGDLLVWVGPTFTAVQQ